MDESPTDDPFTFLFLGWSDRSRPVSDVTRRLWSSEFNGNYIIKTMTYWGADPFTFLFLGCSDRSRPVSEVIRRLWLSELNGNYLVKTMAYWVADLFTFLFTRLLS